VEHNFARWLFFGCIAMVALMVVIVLWQVLTWLAIGIAAAIVISIAFRLWLGWRRGMRQDRLDEAEAVKAEAAAQAALADADKKRAEAAAAWQRIRLIPANYIGAMIDHPNQSSFYNVWTYKQEVSPALKPLVQPLEPVVEALPEPRPPGPLDLAQVLTTFTPSAGRILLGMTAQGLVTCALEGLSHVALAAPTGGGKSAIMRLLLAQILACQATVWLADPHYTALDSRSGEDWRMIAVRLAKPPYTQPRQIKDMLVWLLSEMHHRYELRAQGQPWGAPCYLAIDEWPAILSELDKQDTAEVVAATGKLLRQGRKVDVHLITSSQDFLVETIGSGGEMRANLRTAYFAGGGLATARALLDQQIKLPDAPLGKGLVLLRSEEAMPVPSLVRVPYASNEALYRLLPMSQGVPPLPPLPMKVSPDSLAPDAPTEPASGVFLSPLEREKREKASERARILELHEQGFKPYVIARQLGRAGAYTEFVKQVIAEEETDTNGTQA
jgi:hypothetical protein